MAGIVSVVFKEVCAIWAMMMETTLPVEYERTGLCPEMLLQMHTLCTFNSFASRCFGYRSIVAVHMV